MLCASTVRTLVRTHGQTIRRSADAETQALLAQPEGSTVLRLVPRTQSRCRTGWLADLAQAVDLAVAAGEARPPQGVTYGDWARVLEARRKDATRTLEALRHLGPELEENEVLLTSDAVLTPQTEAKQYWELRTASLVTAEGTRYVSGRGEHIVDQLRVLGDLWRRSGRSVLVIADGARWIRAFFTAVLAAQPGSMLLLDWYHLRQTCRDLSSRICHGRLARRPFLARLLRHLWHGEVDMALAYLPGFRPQARTPKKRDELCTYLLSAQKGWVT